MGLRAAILGGLAVLVGALLGMWQFAPSVLTEARGLMDGERLAVLVARAGIWGPAVIVTLMAVAVVASPIPSAPIALAAGAAYGHLWGTVQVVIGAELGALERDARARAARDVEPEELIGATGDRGAPGLVVVGGREGVAAARDVDRAARQPRLRHGVRDAAGRDAGRARESVRGA